MVTSESDIADLPNILTEAEEKLVLIQNKLIIQKEEKRKTESLISQFQECLSKQNEVIKKLSEEQNRVLKEKNNLLKKIKEEATDREEYSNISESPYITNKLTENLSQVLSERKRQNYDCEPVTDHNKKSKIMTNTKEMNKVLVTTVDKKTTIHHMWSDKPHLFVCGSNGFLVRFNGTETVVYKTDTTEDIWKVWKEKRVVVAFAKTCILWYKDMESEKIMKKQNFTSEVYYVSDSAVSRVIALKDGHVFVYHCFPLRAIYLPGVKMRGIAGCVKLTNGIMLFLKDGKVFKTIKNEVIEVSEMENCIAIESFNNDMFYAICGCLLYIFSLDFQIIETFQMEVQIKLAAFSGRRIAIFDCNNKLTICVINKEWKVCDHYKLQSNIVENITSMFHNNNKLYVIADDKIYYVKI